MRTTVVLAFSLPFLVLVLQAFADSWTAPSLIPQEFGLRGFRDGFAGGGAGVALTRSLLVAFVVTAVSLLLAWPAARVIGERRLRHPGPVVLLLAVPILISPFAIGTGMTGWFVRLGLTDSVAGLVLAHIVFSLPYAVLVLSTGFSRRLRLSEEMASSMGIGPWRRLLMVTLPETRPTLALAALMAFLVSWGQYGSSLAISGGSPTLPVVLLPFIGSDFEVAAALSLLFLVPAVLALAAANRAGRVR
ncbi:MAG: hypothetical protein IPK93_11850 [Solirubrobacterales bacterium]|nr:hypothetical protein [Solirubrobacterales bacterium]